MEKRGHVAVVHADLPDWVFTLIDILTHPRRPLFVWLALWCVSVPLAGGALLAAFWNLVMPVRFALPEVGLATGVLAALSMMVVAAPFLLLMKVRISALRLRMATLTAWGLYLVAFAFLVVMGPSA